MLLIWSPILAEAIGPTTANELPLADRAAFLFGDGCDCGHRFTSKRKDPRCGPGSPDGFVGLASSESAFSAAIALATALATWRCLQRSVVPHGACGNVTLVLGCFGSNPDIPANSREEEMSKLLAAIALLCLASLSGSTLAQVAASCEQKCAQGCAGKGNYCMTRCSTNCAQTGGQSLGRGKY